MMSWSQRFDLETELEKAVARRRWGLVILCGLVLLFVFVLILKGNWQSPGDGKLKYSQAMNPPKAHSSDIKEPSLAKGETVQYEVIRSYFIDDGEGYNQILLVPDETTKKQALALADALTAKAKSEKGRVFISIFDDKDAAMKYRDWDVLNENVRERLTLGDLRKWFYSHWLVEITYNPYTGYAQCEWFAENRDH